MLEVMLPRKALDEHYGYDHQLRFDALAVYFYANIYGDYKPWYIIHIPYEWNNRNWEHWPVSKEALEPLEYKVLGTQSDDLLIGGSNGVLQFSQIEPVDGLANKAEEKRLKELTTMEFHSLYKNFHPTEKEFVRLPISVFHEVLAYDAQRNRYMPERWQSIRK